MNSKQPSLRPTGFLCYVFAGKDHPIFDQKPELLGHVEDHLKRLHDFPEATSSQIHTYIDMLKWRNETALALKKDLASAKTSSNQRFNKSTIEILTKRIAFLPDNQELKRLASCNDYVTLEQKTGPDWWRYAHTNGTQKQNHPGNG